MSEANDDWRPWDTAPKDGPAIHVEFPDGTPALARWDAGTSPDARWKVRDSIGHWHEMEYQHGSSTPVRWRLAPRPKGEMWRRA